MQLGKGASGCVEEHQGVAEEHLQMEVWLGIGVVGGYLAMVDQLHSKVEETLQEEMKKKQTTGNVNIDNSYLSHVLLVSLINVV